METAVNRIAGTIKLAFTLVFMLGLEIVFLIGAYSQGWEQIVEGHWVIGVFSVVWFGGLAIYFFGLGLGFLAGIYREHFGGNS